MRRMWVLVLMAGLVAGCSQDVDTPAHPASTTGAGSTENDQCDPVMESALAAWAEVGFSGSIAMTTDGEVDCVAAYGWADQAAEVPNRTETVFNIGSITKAFTAASVLALVDDGELSLDDRAGDLIPSLGGPAAEATVMQLLLHTSGLTGSHGMDHEPLDRDAAIAAIGGLEQAFEPGTDYAYSNAGYTLLALIVDEVSGSSYRDFTASTTLRLPTGDLVGGFWDGSPAAPGPRSIGHLDDGTIGQVGDFAGPHWALDGNGSVAMSVVDLARWADALFAGEIVSPESVEVLRARGFDHGDGTAESPGWVWLDSSRFGEPLLAAAGGGGDVGHDAVVAWLPQSNRVIAIASNTQDITAEELIAELGPALVSGAPLPLPAGSGEAGPSDRRDIAGRYELASGDSFDVVADGERLTIAAIGASAVTALFPLPSDATPDEVSVHEEAVLALLAGETQQGREEVEILEGDLGAIVDVTLAGTILEDGELRTYVTIDAADGTVTAWYALDDRGGVAAVEIGDPPSAAFISIGASAYEAEDPTDDVPDVTVTFADGALVVTSPDDATEAVKAP